MVINSSSPKGLRKISIGITWKVLLFTMFAIGLEADILYYYTTRLSTDLLREKMEETGRVLATSVASNAQLSIQVGDYAALQAMMETLQKDYSLVCATIYDSNGTIIASTEKQAVGSKDSEILGFNKLSYKELSDREGGILRTINPIVIEEVQLSQNEPSESESTLGADFVFTEDAQSSSTPSSQQVKVRTTIGYVSIEISMKPLQNSEKAIRRKILQISSIVYLALFVIVMFSVNRFIKPLSHLVEVLKGITEDNDLNRRVEIPRQREMRYLSQAFNSLIDNLKIQIGQTKDAAVEIVNALTPITDAVKEQEAASREQVATVSETIASMAELSQSSKMIDENAKKVASFADETERNARQGVASVERVVDSIHQIEEKTGCINENVLKLVDELDHIQQIINIIDLFTEQTKLIAFNAAIEATSAKAAGRRFGVVAGEVKKLAGDIEKSSRDITTVIKEIRDMSDTTVEAVTQGREEVEKGVKLSREAKEQIARIFQSVSQTNRVTKQISVFTTQQIKANDEVVKAVKTILTLAESSMQHSESTKTAAENLKQLAATLTERVDAFHIAAQNNE